MQTANKPSGAFVAASWISLLLGMLAFFAGIWNAQMQLNEKGFYFVLLMYGLFSAVSLQKTVRDQLDGIPVTGIYLGLAWFSTALSVVLLAVGLWNAQLSLSEKGFYAMAFVLCLFSSVAIQKNIRDSKSAD
jgi:uncharacterized membrane protein YiaA